ncbi:uncharacterized protein ALTATR162_LOCUS5182 [Alternaria atra]|uniref:Uncharacterized protein n=1 Tax=Alternaria atra TaxID=119953 RepID=A0A8J2I2L2_9PLEO|nr:uncharacterized protein ALTATR162_LOCUS5182 [Alternaria atra]CAG5158640.1 unnamed protein product [Alternaria atra]
MGVLWILLLITSTAIRTKTWYLVAVGFVGMAQNLFLGAVVRSEIISERKVMWTLMRLELKYKGFGKTLLPEFFLGILRKEETDWWSSTNEEERKKILEDAVAR